MNKIYIVLGQVASSVSNFIVGFFVLWSMSNNEFADYTIVFSLVLFLVSVQNSLINTPLMVEKGNYSNALVRLFFSYGVRLSIAFVVPVFFLLYIFDVDNIGFLSLVFFPVLMWRELCRMTMLWFDDFKFMARLEVLQLISLLLLLSFFYGFCSIDIIYVYISIAISALVFTIVVVFSKGMNRVYLGEFCYFDLWHEIKWSLKGVLITEINSRGYVYIVSIFFGKDFLALLNAPRLIVNPINSIAYAFVKYCRPKVAEAVNRGGIEESLLILKEYKIITFLLAFFSAVLCCLLWEWIYSFFFYKFEYIYVSYIAVFWFVILLFQISNMYSSNFIQVCRKFKCLFFVSVVSSLMVFSWLSAVVVLGLDGFYVLPSIGFSEVIIFLGLMKLKNKIIAKK